MSGGVELGFPRESLSPKRETSAYVPTDLPNTESRGVTARQKGLKKTETPS